MFISWKNAAPEIRDYLARVRRTRGLGCNGVFIPLDAPGFGGRIFFALVALVILYFVCRPPTDNPVLVPWQTALAAFVVLLVGSAWGVHRARSLSAEFGPMRFLDSRYWWEIGIDGFDAIPLDDLREVKGTHRYLDGTHVSTTLRLHLPDGVRELVVSDERLGERVATYLQCLIALRRPSADGSPSSLADQPETLAALATKLADGETDIALSNLNRGDRIPPAIGRSALPGLHRLGLPWVAAAAAGVVGWFAFPQLNLFVQDEHLFRVASLPAGTDVSAADAYLESFPQGRHASEVIALRDDRLYSKAVAESENRRSPTELRKYLADARNTRRRSQAQAKINVFYDEAAARLRSLALGRTDDGKLFAGLLALLDDLKTSTRPVVTVGFVGSQSPKPMTQEHRLTEELVHAARLKQNSELAGIARKRSDGSAILDCGKTFDADVTRRREAVILEKVRLALTQALGADILTLEAAADGQKPMLEIGYRIFAPGNLFLYTSTRTVSRQSLYGSDTRETVRTVEGLLRGYHVEWNITLRTPSGKGFAWKVESAPANQLKLDATDSDPEWAPYAVILYSAFHDMSARLIEGFGLKAEPAPSSFTFAQAAGK